MRNEPDLVGAHPSFCQPDLKSVQVNLEIIKTSSFNLKNWNCWHQWWQNGFYTRKICQSGRFMGRFKQLKVDDHGLNWMVFNWMVLKWMFYENGRSLNQLYSSNFEWITWHKMMTRLCLGHVCTMLFKCWITYLNFDYAWDILSG